MLAEEGCGGEGGGGGGQVALLQPESEFSLPRPRRGAKLMLIFPPENNVPSFFFFKLAFNILPLASVQALWTNGACVLTMG